IVQDKKILEFKLHELVEQNVSDIYEQKFKKTLTGNEFYLKDHIIDNKKIFPGVAYLEMARVAGELALGREVKKIRNVIWSRPIVVEDENARREKETFISLYSNNDEIDYEIWTYGNENRRTVHSQGKLDFCDVLQQEKMEIEKMRSSFKKCMAQHEIYDIFMRLGFKYGSSFRTINDLFLNDNEALGYLELPDNALDNHADLKLHPSIMDGALQTTIGILASGDKKTIYLPFSIDELWVVRPITKKCYVHTVLKSTESEIKKFDIRIFDKAGHLLLGMRDFSLKAYRDAAASDVIYFQPRWKEKPFSEGVENRMHGKVLLFDLNEGLYNKMRTASEDSSSSVILVKNGAQFKKISDDVFEINHKNRDDYLKLIDMLSSEKKLPSYIVHAWSMQIRGEDALKIENCLDFSIFSLFYLVQSIIRNQSMEDIKILYVSANETSSAVPVFQATGGFLRSVNIENTKIKCRRLEIADAGDIEIVADMIVREMLEREIEVRHVSNSRYIKETREVSNFGEHIPLPLKEQGVYLITGGTGGLGQIFGRYIAEKINAKLILIGRSEPGPEKLLELKEIESLGSQIIFLKCDISDREKVAELVSEIKTKYKNINGIIHAAGVLRDSYIFKKSKESVYEVIKPKLNGTIYLDEFLKDEPLDFFVMFSSFVAMTGNLGQSDYAYANSFLDSFSEERERARKEGRRHGKTLSINWPLWSEGGMRVDRQTEKFFESNFGMRPLLTQDGIKAFEMGLCTDVNQFMVASGQKRRLREVFGTKMDKNPAKAKEKGEHKSVMEENLILEKLNQVLIDKVVEILHMAREDIDVEMDLNEFGFDSITFTMMSNSLNEKFGINLMPSIFFEHKSLSSFSNYLVREYKRDLTRKLDSDVLKGNIEGSGDLPDRSYEEYEEQDEKVPIEEGTQYKEFTKRSRKIEKRLDIIETCEAYDCKNTEYGRNTEPVAIIGLSGVLPQSPDLHTFWDNLVSGKDMISEIPKERWNWEDYYGDPKNDENRTNVKWGGFIKDIDKFDPLFFGLSPREAELMDPQQRIFLETVWKTIEDAGYSPQDLYGTKTGVFVGAGSSDYNDYLSRGQSDVEALSYIGVANSILANRVSFLLNLHGPSEPVDTACSSSLVAIHRAVEAIKSGDCDIAIAGGVYAILSPTLYISFSKAGMLSVDGRCKTFDKNANGYVRGEGTGAVLLKPLSRARDDGDHIYGLIIGTSVMHGGRAASLTAPNPNVQSELIERAWEKAGIKPWSISYIEAHGTGTPLGDPIEINGLKKAFENMYRKHGKEISKNPHCAVGSVKTNIGHLEIAAGIAGLIKILLSMKHKKIPGNLHFSELNPQIKLEKSPLYLANRTIDWNRLRDEDGSEIPRRAGISSFGFGGAYAHVAIEEYHEEERQSVPEVPEKRIFVLSAKDEDRLKAYSQALIGFLERSRTKAVCASHSGADLSELKTKLVLELKHLVSEVIHVPEREIDVSEEFIEYGFDNVALNRLIDLVNRKYNISVLLSEVSDNLSVEGMASFLLKNFREKFIGSSEGNICAVEKYEYTVNLTDLAYTLQMSRGGMEERIAVVAGGAAEILEKLHDYLQGKHNADIFTGNVKKGRSAAQKLVSGRAGKEFLKIVMEDKDYSKIAELWVSGIDIDWNMIYGNQKPRRISLPAYPFARQSYMLKVKKKAESSPVLQSDAKLTVNRKHWVKTKVDVSPYAFPEGKIAILVNKDTQEFAKSALNAKGIEKVIIQKEDFGKTDLPENIEVLLDLSDLYGTQAESQENNLEKVGIFQKFVRNRAVDKGILLHFTRNLQAF
ncbi:MAG: SDR family NAD(P)-dependent oxidoreductase, partial [Oligoflexales bacterium]|nr:SDR family NAD(P)-dependent oxidoreductase [Oligoflexales bacterium]